MTDSSAAQSSALGSCLARLETLIETLDRLDDVNARAVARELLDATLDLHGLALARIMTICNGAENGDLLLRDLLADNYVAAVALLHGLHPEDAETRLRNKVAAMRPHWGVRGFRVDVIAVDRTAARIRMTFSNDNSRAISQDLAHEVEQALTEAAPDLESITVEGLDEIGGTSEILGKSIPLYSSDVGAGRHERQGA